MKYTLDAGGLEVKVVIAYKELDALVRGEMKKIIKSFPDDHPTCIAALLVLDYYS